MSSEEPHHTRIIVRGDIWQLECQSCIELDASDSLDTRWIQSIRGYYIYCVH